MKSKINQLIKSIKPWLSKHSNAIMTGTGMCLVAASVVHTGYATIKATKKVEKLKEEKSLTKTEIVKETWKYYIPPVVEFLSAELLIFGGFRAESKKVAALSLAYTAAETALTEYQDTVKEVVGEKKENEIREKASEKVVQKLDNNVVQSLPILDDGTVWFIDDLTRQAPFKSTWQDVRAKANDLNCRINTNAEGLVTVNDWLDALGLEPVATGYELGWRWNHMIDISLDASVRDGRVFGVIRYRNMPVVLNSDY